MQKKGFLALALFALIGLTSCEEPKPEPVEGVSNNLNNSIQLVSTTTKLPNGNVSVNVKANVYEFGKQIKTGEFNLDSIPESPIYITVLENKKTDIKTNVDTVKPKVDTVKSKDSK